MINLYDELPIEEKNEDENINTVGDSLAYQFYCGNFSYSVNKMIEENISVNDFIEWLEELSEEYGNEDGLNTIYGGHFSPSFWVELGRSVKF